MILINNNNTKSPDKSKFNRKAIQLLILDLYIASDLKEWILFTLSQKGRRRSREKVFFKLLGTCGSAATPSASSGSEGCANPRGSIMAAVKVTKYFSAIQFETPNFCFTVQGILRPM